METTLTDSLQFYVKEMSLILSTNEIIDLTGLFAEINLYEGVFTPCRSGNIIITDAIGLYDKIDIKGNQSIRFKIQKSKDDIDGLQYYKEFKIYNLTDRKNISSTSQSYVLHFVNEDFVFSLQKKVSQSYFGSYSNIAEKILTNHLKVPKEKPSKGKSGINTIFPTDADKNFIIPNLTPFDAITWLAKRSISSKYKQPDYLFFENYEGYNFVPISFLWEKPPQWNINVKPKNAVDDMNIEFLGARELKVLSQFNMLNTIKDGSYAGKFVGFDTFTKTIAIKKINNVFDNSPTHGNKNTNLSETKSKDNTNFFEMYDSRVATYPFALPRLTQAYIKQKSPAAASVIDNTHDYIFQRRAIFTNLMQKRIELTMPGNFGFNCGNVINLDIPKFSLKDDTQNTDDTLNGKYIILGVRHIIRYKTHETLLEVATDSTKR